MKASHIKIGSIILFLAVAIPIVFFACLFYSLKDEGKPIVISTSDVTSPDTRWVATLETVDNGLGFGLGRLYDEVHVRRPHDVISDHGDPDESVVFYIDSTENAGNAPRVTWSGATHLVIKYHIAEPTGTGPGKSVASFRGLSIEYQAGP